MKITIPSCLFLFAFYFPLYAQDFSKIDAHVRTYRKADYKTPEALAQALTKPFGTDVEKYRAIFSWIAFNIQYDREKAKKTPSSIRLVGTDQEIEAQEKALTQKNLTKTYRSGKGICEDYCQLYKKMAEAAGLRCEMVVGKSRQLNGNVGGSHAWNAIWVDGAWHLLDATWGAGGTENNSKDFKPEFKSACFMAPPRLFILDHFPDDSRWQLLPTPLTQKEVNQLPHVHYANAVYPLNDFSFQSQGSGKTAEIGLKFSHKKPAIIHLYNANGKPVEYTQGTRDGFLTLQFKTSNTQKVEVYVSESTDKMETLIATFQTRP